MDYMKTTIIPKGLGWGVYLWQKADGELLSDGDGNVLVMNGQKGDLEAVRKMRQAATYYGHADGQPVFAEGRRKVSQAQYEAQLEAMLDGKDPESAL